MRMRSRYLLSLTFWPFRWVAIRSVGPIAERALERKMFRFITGLDPILFKPDNVKVSPWCGFVVLQGVTNWVPLPEAIRVGEELSISDFLQAEGPATMDAELRAVAALAQRMGQFASTFKLMHTAYYRSNYVIQDIAEKISDSLILSFRGLITLQKAERRNGLIHTWVTQSDGETAEYEFPSELAKVRKMLRAVNAAGKGGPEPE